MAQPWPLVRRHPGGVSWRSFQAGRPGGCSLADRSGTHSTLLVHHPSSPSRASIDHSSSPAPLPLYETDDGCPAISLFAGDAHTARHAPMRRVKAGCQIQCNARAKLRVNAVNAGLNKVFQSAAPRLNNRALAPSPYRRSPAHKILQ